MNLWSRLPNASHIDWVLESARTHPHAWAETPTSATRHIARIEARIAAVNVARSAAENVARLPAWDEARITALSEALDAATISTLHVARTGEARIEALNVARRRAWDAVMPAVSALVAYDHAGKYLDMTSDQVRLWAALSEDPAAILMLPAVVAREHIEQEGSI